jgi:hypothetical protein
MKALDFVIGFAICIIVFFFIGGGNFHSLDNSKTPTVFKTNEHAYLVIDSTEVTIEDGTVFTDKKKENGVKIEKTIIEYYTIMYKDNNGVIHRIKHVYPNMLLKSK